MATNNTSQSFTPLQSSVDQPSERSSAATALSLLVSAPEEGSLAYALLFQDLISAIHRKMLPGRNNILSKMHLILYLCILASGSLGAALNQPCENNSDCHENHYCYTVTNECAPCIPNFCRRFHRKDSLWKKCPAEIQDCDSCLPGYEEEILTDGSKRQACIFSNHPTIAHSTDYPNIGEDSSSTYLSSIIGLPLLVVLMIGVAYNRFRFPVNSAVPRAEETELQPIANQCSHDVATTNNVYPQASAPMLPPEYNRNDPYILSQSQELVVSPQGYFEHRVEAKHSTHLLQAGVFRKPDYEEEQQDSADSVLDAEGEEDVDPDSQEAEGNSIQGDCRTIPAVQYHDETTMPSDWTPGPQQTEEDNASLSTGPETVKRPSTEMASSDSDDGQNPKRTCNDENEEEDEACSSSVLPNPYRNFTAALSSIRQNPNTAHNSAQNKSTNSYSNLKEN